MAPVNHGYRKEDEMKTFLNNKVAGTLSQNLRELVINLFGVVDPNGVVYCEDGIDFTKPDFVLSYLTKKRYVSMKSGRADICHTEMANTFIPFLRSIGVSEETLRTILLHHYGDGTVNGTGKKRYDNRQVYEWLKDRIKKANIELNNLEIIHRVCDRALFQGVRDDVPPADAIYHGDYEHGSVASRVQIELYLDDKNWLYAENLHCGPLFLRPHARYVDVEIKKPIQRQKVVLYWPNMPKDIAYISKRYNDYIPEKYMDIECEDSNGILMQKPKIPKRGLWSWLNKKKY